MGVIRSAPDKHISISSSQQARIRHVTGQTCGWQYFMEDFEISEKINDELYLFALIDGHGGPEVADYCKQLLPSKFKQSQLIKLGQYQAAVENILVSIDKDLLKDKLLINQIRSKYHLPELAGNLNTLSGASIVLCLISSNNCIIANIGQCKSYVFYKATKQKAVLLSNAHNNTNPQEEKRVLNAKGYFYNGKLNGVMPSTRSIGDLNFKSDHQLPPEKQLIVAEPSVFKLCRDDMELIVLGTGGLWQKPKEVLKLLLEQGETKNIDQQGDTKLETMEGVKGRIGRMLQSLISQSIQSAEGLRNMSVTVIEFN